MIKINQLLASQNTVEDDKELSDKTEGLLNCTSSIKVSKCALEESPLFGSHRTQIADTKPKPSYKAG